MTMCREEEMKAIKTDLLSKIEGARQEGERQARMEAEARLAREKADADKRLNDLQRMQNDASGALEEVSKNIFQPRLCCVVCAIAQL
jgi:uncharacterized membrane protein (DUF106 family)